MRITFVLQKLDITGGGSNKSIDIYSRKLCKRGYDISVLTLSPSENTLPASRPYTIIEAQGYNSINTLNEPSRIVRILRQHETQTDIYHIFNPRYIPSAGIYRTKGGDTPVVGRLNTYSMFCYNMSMMNGECHKNCTTFAKFAHDDDTLRKRLGKLPVYSYKTHVFPKLANKTDRMFAVSPAVEDIYSDIGVKQELISVVPTFYDEDFPSNECLQEQSDEFTILYVGRVEPIKGIDLLLDALAELPTVRAKIIGEGSQMESLEAKAARQETRDRIDFCGWVNYDDLPKYYNTADLFVHPGRWPEPLGRTIYEALQHDLPCVVSDIGGPPWLVGDAGETFRRNDAQHLAAQIQDIITDTNRYNSLKSNCSDELKKVHPKNSLNKLEHEYDQVINSSSVQT